MPEINNISRKLATVLWKIKYIWYLAELLVQSY